MDKSEMLKEINIKDVNWSIVIMAMNYRIKQLEQKIMICNSCEDYSLQLDDIVKEYELYQEEYKKLLILQQKSNKER